MTRREKAKELVESLPDDLDVTVDEVEEDLDQLVNEFNLPIDEAVRSTQNKYMNDYDGDGEFSSSPSSPQDEDYDIGELTVDQDEEWMNIRGTVQQFFDLSESQASWIEQRGVIGDDTGTTIFTVPKRAVKEDDDLKLEEGETYELRGVVGEVYDGDVQLMVTPNTSASKLEETYTPPSNTTQVTGCIVNIQSGSGLIKRCTSEDENGDACGRALDNDRCGIHGDADGEFDLRLMATVDDGNQAYDVFFGKEATEALTDISLDDAIEIAKDAMQTEAVLKEIEPMLLGRYYSIAGNDGGEYIIVNQFERVQRDWQEEAEVLMGTLDDDEVAA